MAEILADRDLKKLLGTCIKDASEDCIKSNTYELRLGEKVRFKLTDDEIELKPEEWVEFGPGESIDVTSIEIIDFRKESVEKIFKGIQTAFTRGD